MKLSQRGLKVGGGAVTVALVGGAWLFAIHPELSKASSLQSQTADVQTANLAQMAKNSSLAKEAKSASTIAAQLDQAAIALPYVANVPAYTASLFAAAAVTGVKIQSVSPSAPTAVSANGTAVSSSTTTTVGSAAGKLFSIPVTINATGSVAADRKFLAAIQTKGGRASLVSSVAISGDTGTSSAITIQLSVFCSPKSPTELTQMQKDLAASLTK